MRSTLTVILRTFWLNKSNHQGIKIIARTEKTTEKAAADERCRVGLSRYLAELLRRHAANERLNRERAAEEELIATLDGIKQLRKMLAGHGMSEYRSKRRGL